MAHRRIPLDVWVLLGLMLLLVGKGLYDMIEFRADGAARVRHKYEKALYMAVARIQWKLAADHASSFEGVTEGLAKELAELRDNAHELKVINITAAERDRLRARDSSRKWRFIVQADPPPGLQPEFVTDTGELMSGALEDYLK